MTHDQLHFDDAGNIYAIKVELFLATHRCPRCGYRWSPDLCRIGGDLYVSFPGERAAGRQMTPDDLALDCPACGAQIGEFELEELP